MSAARLIVFLVVALAVIAAGYRVYLAADWVVDRCGAPIAAWWRRGLGEAAPAAPVDALSNGMPTMQTSAAAT